MRSDAALDPAQAVKYSAVASDRTGRSLGRTTYGSPTTSDQALLDIPSLKLGVGDSARSHSADEFVHLSEIREGIELYIEMLKAVL